MDRIQALHLFYSSFGLNAYDENSVPEGTNLPYITYQVVIGNYGDDTYTSASLWYYSTSWAEIEKKVLEIDKALSNGGINIPYDDGNLWIKKSTPFAQRIADSNDMVKRYNINLAIEYH